MHGWWWGSADRGGRAARAGMQTQNEAGRLHRPHRANAKHTAVQKNTPTAPTTYNEQCTHASVARERFDLATPEIFEGVGAYLDLLLDTVAPRRLVRARGRERVGESLRHDLSRSNALLCAPFDLPLSLPLPHQRGRPRDTTKAQTPRRR